MLCMSTIKRYLIEDAGTSHSYLTECIPPPQWQGTVGVLCPSPCFKSKGVIWRCLFLFFTALLIIDVPMYLQICVHFHLFHLSQVLLLSMLFAFCPNEAFLSLRSFLFFKKYLVFKKKSTQYFSFSILLVSFSNLNVLPTWY